MNPGPPQPGHRIRHCMGVYSRTLNLLCEICWQQSICTLKDYFRAIVFTDYIQNKYRGIYTKHKGRNLQAVILMIYFSSFPDITLLHICIVLLQKSVVI